MGLLFHEDFTPRLIALGYEDARARHQDLEEFFHPTATSAGPIGVAADVEARAETKGLSQTRY